MNRGDILVFETDDKQYKDWKYFRAIRAVTEENKTEAKLFIIGNVYTKDKKIKKAEKLFIWDFFKMAQKGETYVAEEADAALIFLTNTEF
jgi:hypothetical protein